MRGRKVVIDFTHELVLIALDGISELDESTFILWSREAFAEVYRRLTQLRNVDSIVLEWVRQRDGSACSAVCRCICREVPGQHCRRRNVRALCDGILTRDRALIAAKEEQLVLNKRPP